MKRIGLIVNPIAGIGGKTGLKGSDGEEVFREAIARGAVMESPKKAFATVQILKASEAFVDVYTWPGKMGEDICKEAGLRCTVPAGYTDTGSRTTSEDTVRAAKELVKAGSELILFAGGDGTARDIMDAVGTGVPVLGIPAGCKIHSGVYALNPRRAGDLAVKYAQGKVRETKEAEVMDIDEAQFRNGKVQSRLYGYLKIPGEGGMVQNIKCGSTGGGRESIERLYDYMADTWCRNARYIIGGGSTTAGIMKRMNLSNTLLGVDLVYGGQVLALDCTEQDILRIMERYEKVKILITVIGGQGYLFGRGNQQISAKVIRRVGKENIIVAASQEKMLSFLGKNIYVDTGDEETDKYLAGYMRIITGYGEYAVIKVSN